ncbi:GIY-YIG nuclease family protein [Nonomuraea sp. NPDC050680]|uniref:GIY-YIG nuclease family protein n=1 Tax=Nonomuraea sp. NPDC050680 TaxID=3154630 RepID=UPI0033CFB60E
MARDPLAAVSTVATPQSQPIPGQTQVKNAAGGYVWCVYALTDPLTGAVFYVGKTIQLRVRIREHLNDRTDSKKAQRIRALRLAGLAPAVSILEEGTGDWCEAERRWIAEHRAAGVVLANRTDGGEGLHGASAETRLKISLAQRARWVGGRREQSLAISRHPERRLAISEALKGRKKSPEHVANLPQNQRGYDWAPDILERRREVLLERAMPVAHSMERSPAQQEHLKRVQEANRGRPGWARGRVLSEAERAVRSAALTGKPKTPEHKERIRQAALRRWARTRAAANQLPPDGAE